VWIRLFSGMYVIRGWLQWIVSKSLILLKILEMYSELTFYSDAVMIAQWNSSLSILPVARVQFPATAEYFKGFFPGWSHSANLSWASVAENGSISSQWHHTTCGQRGGRPKFNNGQKMASKKKSYTHAQGDHVRKRKSLSMHAIFPKPY